MRASGGGGGGARPAGRKKRAVGGGDEWVIDVAEGPIRQVLISNEFDRLGEEYVRRIDYLVPDSRFGLSFSRRGVHYVVAFSKEEGDEEFYILTAEVISRLNQAKAIAKGIRELIVRVDPDHSCWVLTEGAWREHETHGLISAGEPNLADAVVERAPSRLQWNHYQAIASRLLATPVLEAVLVDRHPTVRLCAALRDLGADARVMEQDPFTEEPGVRWHQRRRVQKGVDARVREQDPFSGEPRVRWVAVGLEADPFMEEPGERWVQEGVDASVMEQDSFMEEPRVRWVPIAADADPFTEEARVRWVQIADGPIQWVELGLGTLKAADRGMLDPRVLFLSATGTGLGLGTLCYVPDARIAPDSPQIRMASVRVKSFPLFGRVTRVRWEYADLGVPGRDFSSRISEYLGQDPAVTEAIKSSGSELCIGTDPDRGCWILAADDRPMTKWTSGPTSLK